MAEADTQPGVTPITAYQCRCRCGHTWVSKAEERPRVCPKCKSPNWDRPYQFRVVDGERVPA